MRSCFILFTALSICGCASYEKLERSTYDLKETARIIDQDNTRLLIINEEGDWTVQNLENQDSFKVSAPKQTELTTSSIHPSFVIENKTGARRYISNRLLDVEGVLNFRDLGGIVTQDGKQTRWGFIYRSGHMHKLTSTGLGDMNALGIKKVIDLRTLEESEKKPDRIPEGNAIQLINLPYGGMHYHEIHQARKDIQKQTPKEFDGAGKMEEISRRFVREATPQLRQIFDYLLDENSVPLVFHCTAGKDRTGFTSAMILASLGVSKETIMDEYLLSNYYRYDLIERKAKLGARLLGIDHRASRTIMDVRPSYLEAGFDEIKREYQSVENFLKEGVGLTGSELKKLQNKYLY